MLNSNFSNWITDHRGFVWVDLQNDPCQHQLLYNISHRLLGPGRPYGYSCFKWRIVRFQTLQHVCLCVHENVILCVCMRVFV